MYNKECCGTSLLEEEVEIENSELPYAKQDDKAKEVIRYLRPDIKPENYTVPQGE